MDYTHDHLILVIQTLYPALVHGRDFLVAHPIDPGAGGQCGEPFIASWKSTVIAQPDEAVLQKEFAANEATYRATFARNRRDRMLAVTDGKANPPTDAPDAVKAKADAWGVYRQALRALPEQPGFPLNITWPVAPS